MVTVHDFKESQKKQSRPTTPKILRFYTAVYTQRGNNASTVLDILVDNGDVDSVLDQVIENDGLWTNERTVFIPWPCAHVEVLDPE